MIQLVLAVSCAKLNEIWTTEDYLLQYSDFIRFSSNFQDWERELKESLLQLSVFSIYSPSAESCL